MKKISMLPFTRLLTFTVLLLSCTSNAQMDVSKLSPKQWQEDLAYIVSRVNKSFPGFTPESKLLFNQEAEKLRIKMATFNSTQAILEMAKLVATLNDGHTELTLTHNSTGFHRLPLLLYFFGEDLHIVATDEQHATLVGSVIREIDGTATSKIFEALKPLMNADNDVEFISAAPNLIVIPEVLHGLELSKTSNEVTLTLSDEAGTETKHKIKAIDYNQYASMKLIRTYQKAPLYLENLDKDYWYRYLNDSKVMYLNVKSLFNQNGKPSVKNTINEVFEEIDKSHPNKFVIDLRLCSGGNYNNALTLVDEIKKRPWLNKKGKVYVVNGRLTFSAASVTTLYLREETEALIVGEVSRARPNWAENMESYKLPNSKLDFDCLNRIKVHFPNLEKSNKIPVDGAIGRSFKAYQMGEDEVMNYIISN